eukprot:gnl/MRDRNA2_/MRDRNA2_98542_c0_seq1.p1 gnl/MRDRNA2_/MRDRNA2_98542_c0~~gnl/MRDRNA2_/MRDRNA2_98542_c0_seq1.p1  ORF type:complete len:504 (+),score=137.50 gnl/MRDRNA2_/MRDRNA2_98542_c0_seq1:66-1514(+)
MGPKVTPADAEEEGYGAYGYSRLTFKKPIPCNPPLLAYDENYVRRKKEVGQKSFTCKSGRSFCYFTDGADPSQESVAVVLCLHACCTGKHLFLQPEPFTDIFQICPDRMGHGKSSPTPVDSYPFDELVPELVELVDAVYLESKIPPEKKFFVVGSSMGATIAIEMAACPEVRDRIEAIAPMSGPCDMWNPSMTNADRKATGAMAFMYNSQKKGCGGAINRWMLNKMSSIGLNKPNKDYGMKEYYLDKESMRQGTKLSWDVMDNNPFYTTLLLDVMIPGCVTVHDGVNEFKRAFGAPWSYDPREVKVPCFIYNGNPEETTVKHAEYHHKMIKGSELIVMEGHGHGSILMESGRIIQALVKKQKVEAPCWAKSQAEATKSAEKVEPAREGKKEDAKEEAKPAEDAKPAEKAEPAEEKEEDAKVLKEEAKPAEEAKPEVKAEPAEEKKEDAKEEEAKPPEDAKASEQPTKEEEKAEEKAEEPVEK